MTDKNGGIPNKRRGFKSTLKSVGNWLWGNPSPIPLDPLSYNREANANMLWMFGAGMNGYDVAFSIGNSSSLTRAYFSCPPVSAVINNKAQAYMNGEVALVNTKGQAKGKPAIGYANLQRLLKKPNFMQSWKQFEAQGYVYKQVQGYNVVLVVKPSGFSGAIDASALWNIPPEMLRITEYRRTHFYQTELKGAIESIKLVYEGNEITLNLDDVFILTDYLPSFSNSILPSSRLCGLEMPIANVIEAYGSQQTLLRFRGARGIISSAAKDTIGTAPIPDDEKSALENEFKYRYGMHATQSQFIVTSAAVSYTSMMQNAKDMMLLETVTENMYPVCNAYGYPFKLLSAQQTGSLGGSDVDAFKKMLYVDTIIPEAKNDYEQWNALFGTADLGIEIVKDFSDVAVLQEDRVNQGRALNYENQAFLILFMNNMVTQDQWLEYIGMPPKTDGDGGKYYYQLKAEGKEFGVITSNNTQSNGNNDQQQSTANN